MGPTSHARWMAAWLGAGLAATVPAAGWCFEAGAIGVAPIGVERSTGLVGGVHARGLKLDLGLVGGGGQLSLGAAYGDESPLGASVVPYAAAMRADGALATFDDQGAHDRQIDRLEIAHTRHLGPVEYRIGLASGYRLRADDGGADGQRRFTLSGELDYAPEGLPALGLRGGVGYWQAGRPRLRSLDVGNSWAVEGSVELGRVIAPAGWGEAVRAAIRFGVAGNHGDAAPDQARGIDFRFGIGASLRF